MNNISIDIIIPARNARETLEKCLRSVQALECRGPNFHLTPNILVINNNSSDDTESLLQKLKVPYINYKNRGRSNARNYGTSLTDSPFVAFIDADVILPKNWIVEMVGFLLNHPSFVAGESKIIPTKHTDNIFTRAQVTKSSDESLLPQCEGLLSVALNSCACLYLRSTLIANNGFDEALNSYEDLDLAHRTFYNKGFLFSLEHLEVQKIVSTKCTSQYALRNYTKGFYFHKLHKKRQHTNILKLWILTNQLRINFLKFRLNGLEYFYMLAIFFISFNLGFLASVILNFYSKSPTYRTFCSNINFNDKSFGVLFFNNSFWCYNPEDKIKIKISTGLMNILCRVN